jgi:hypothetical protein
MSETRSSMRSSARGRCGSFGNVPAGAMPCTPCQSQPGCPSTGVATASPSAIAVSTLSSILQAREIVGVDRNSQRRSVPRDSLPPLAGGRLSQGCARRTSSTPLPAPRLRGQPTGRQRVMGRRRLRRHAPRAERRSVVTRKPRLPGPCARSRERPTATRRTPSLCG